MPIEEGIFSLSGEDATLLDRIVDRQKRSGRAGYTHMILLLIQNIFSGETEKFLLKGKGKEVPFERNDLFSGKISIGNDVLFQAHFPSAYTAKASAYGYKNGEQFANAVLTFFLRKSPDFEENWTKVLNNGKLLFRIPF